MHVTIWTPIIEMQYLPRKSDTNFCCSSVSIKVYYKVITVLSEVGNTFFFLKNTAYEQFLSYIPKKHSSFSKFSLFIKFQSKTILHIPPLTGLDTFLIKTDKSNLYATEYIMKTKCCYILLYLKL